MNRSLAIPAGCCFFAFAVLLAALHGAVGREAPAETSQSGLASHHGDRGTIPPARTCSALVSNANDNRRLSIDEAEQLLTTLSSQYVRPWRQWAESPRRLYSRAAARPIPTISASIQMSPGATEWCMPTRSVDAT